MIQAESLIRSRAPDTFLLGPAAVAVETTTRREPNKWKLDSTAHRGGGGIVQTETPLHDWHHPSVSNAQLDDKSLQYKDPQMSGATQRS